MIPSPGARSSAGERSPHTREVAGSNPAAPIATKPLLRQGFRSVPETGDRAPERPVEARMEAHDRGSVEYGLSAFYGNAYLLQAAQHLWHASVARKQTYPLPEHELMATLFAALASEAYINTALDLMLGRDDAKGLSWAPLPERWLTGPRLMFGHPVLEAGKEPHQTLVALNKERSRLVHARSIRFGWQVVKGEERTHQPIDIVARYILRVSEAVDTLGREAPELEPLRMVPDGLLQFDTQLARYDPARGHADSLRLAVRRLRVRLAEEEFGTLHEWVEAFGEDPDEAYWTREEDIEEDLPEP
jgi:hypothetical protein